jgi:hypothetical protein
MKKQYKFRNFVLDATMVALTGGFWLIWIFVREVRN